MMSTAPSMACIRGIGMTVGAHVPGNGGASRQCLQSLHAVSHPQAWARGRPHRGRGRREAAAGGAGKGAIDLLCNSNFLRLAAGRFLMSWTCGRRARPGHRRWIPYSHSGTTSRSQGFGPAPSFRPANIRFLETISSTTKSVIHPVTSTRSVTEPLTSEALCFPELGMHTPLNEE